MATLVKQLAKAENNIASALAKRLPVSVWLSAAKAAYNKIPALYECTEDSQKRAWGDAAIMAQIPGMDVHWLPFKNGKTGQKEVVSVTDYKHIVKTALDSGMVDDLYARVVYKDDAFEVIEGTSPSIMHKPNLLSPNRKDSDIVAVYMVGQMKGHNRPHTDVMTVAEVKSIQRRSKAGDKPDGPWLNYFGEMCKKTIIKRGTKTMPRNIFPVEFLQALAREDAEEFDGEVIRAADATILEPGRRKIGAQKPVALEAEPEAPPVTADDLREEIVTLHEQLMTVKDDAAAGDEAYMASGLTAKQMSTCEDVAILTKLRDALVAALPPVKGGGK
jgi:recombination protein RecT